MHHSIHKQNTTHLIAGHRGCAVEEMAKKKQLGQWPSGASKGLVSGWFKGLGFGVDLDIERILTVRLYLHPKVDGALGLS